MQFHVLSLKKYTYVFLMALKKYFQYVDLNIYSYSLIEIHNQNPSRCANRVILHWRHVALQNLVANNQSQPLLHFYICLILPDKIARVLLTKTRHFYLG